MSKDEVKLIQGPITSQDQLDALPPLFEAAFRAEAVGFYTAREVDAIIRMGAGPATALDLFRAGDGVLITRGPRVIGCGAVTLERGDFGATADGLESGHGVVRAVCIDPAFGGRGYGRLIMTALEDLARQRGARVIDLTATRCAEAFYRHLGYRPVRPVTFVSEGLNLHGMAMSRAA